MLKAAIEVTEATSPIGKGTAVIAGTLGRAVALPKAVLTGQEKVLDYLRSAKADDLKKLFRKAKKDPVLHNTLVRVEHGDLLDDYRRLLGNENISIPTKVLGSAALPITNLVTSLKRSTHYNPLTDTVSVFGDAPELALQEVKRARKYKELTNKSLVEAAKNQLIDPKMHEAGYTKGEAEFRRRTWPANAAAWTGLATLLASLHPAVHDKLHELTGFMNISDSPEVNNVLRKVMIGTGALGLGALGGRVAAEIKNKKEAMEKLHGGAADNQPDSKYPKKELAKGVAHEQEHTDDTSIAKEIAKDHLEENDEYYSDLDKAKLGGLNGLIDLLDSF
jgi:hypothetical protein